MNPLTTERIYRGTKASGIACPYNYSGIGSGMGGGCWEPSHLTSSLQYSDGKDLYYGGD